MRRLSPIPALLSIVLLGACGQVVAVESRQMSTDLGESCPDGAAGDRADGAEADPNTPATPVKRTSKSKAVASPRTGGGGSRSTAPRWHSFLPGMFR